MDFSAEINEMLTLNIDGFKKYVQKKVAENKNFLEQVFWLADGSQISVLKALIQNHHDPLKATESDTQVKKVDFTPMIDHVLSLSTDINTGEPVHQAIAEGQTQLALHLLQVASDDEQIQESEPKTVYQLLSRAKFIFTSPRTKKYAFDVNKRDLKGRTLLSLAIDSKNTELLIAVLARGPNVHAPTLRTSLDIPFQPIHQAVVIDSADAVRLLAAEGGQLANPFGNLKDTPVILAARLRKLNALEALLENPVEQLFLEAENNHFGEDKVTGHTAIEELCVSLSESNEKTEALKGIAMLLSRGAEPPRNETMRVLLSRYRVELLLEVERYIEDKPDLVDDFVNRCHLRESALHNIVYADHSWGSSIRHLLGVPSEAGFIVERLISNKHKLNIEKDISSLTTTAKQNLASEKDELKLYAEFVRRYVQAYDSQIFTNRWSTMRWLIAEGNCDWKTVKEYSKSHPTSRSRLILNEMFSARQIVHESLETSPDSTVNANM
ncbi:Dot/Icm T4SS effector AnkC/LegA12 [Legionella waltersii]|uniref:Ankyrin repeat-containing protein n=1 Tax=Legionella waltersii TaxID=66969 RepID=A0A0W1A2H4_9GAMM|nr:Dot/Icm T4SS effector AnkC/LegA12 [Legionella waltersii]KTD75580.1 ankyrin repeat-containing protein [Legionella waltersii]SNU98851.1 ankyrin repeat-containing protein [Legionella waltersii]